MFAPAAGSIVMVLILGIVGCGSSGGNGDENNEDPAPTTTPTVVHTPAVAARAYAVGTDPAGGLALRSDDGGRSWAIVDRNSRGFSGLAFIDDRTGWVVGDDEIQHTTDGGVSWTLQRKNALFEIYEDITFSSPARGVAVGHGEPPGNLADGGSPLVLLTTNAGTDWTAVPIDVRANPAAAQATLREVCFTDDGTGLTVGGGFSAAVLLLSGDAGASWTDIFPQFPQVGLNSIACVGAGNLWVTQSGPRLQHSSDGGATWVDMASALPPELAEASLGALAFLDTHTGWITAALASDPLQPVVLHTTDAGLSWTVQLLPARGGLQSISFASATIGVAVGVGPSFVPDPRLPLTFRTDDGGATWFEGSLPFVEGQLFDVRVLP